MCGTRSSTTASWSTASRPRARCSSRSSTKCPTACPVVFSAHGVPKSVPAEAERARARLARRDLPAGQQGPPPGRAADRGRAAHRVHRPSRPPRGDRHLRPGARRHDDAGRDRRRCRGARRSTPDAPLAFLTQTTLSVDDTAADRRGAAGALPADRRAARRRTSATPPRTARRRSRQIAAECDLVLVIGAPNSSNSLRLVEVAERCGTPARLIQRASEIDPAWLDGVGTLGLTAGASAPETLVREVVERLARVARGRGAHVVTAEEKMVFKLPRAARRLSRARMAVYTTLRRPRPGGADRRIRRRRAGLGQGHRRGRVELQLAGRDHRPRRRRRRFILTMYEQRVDAGRPAVLPRPARSSRRRKGCPVPRTIHDRDGRRRSASIEGKAVALIEFLPGVSVDRADPGAGARGRRGAGADASRRARDFPRHAGQRAGPAAHGASLLDGCGADGARRDRSRACRSWSRASWRSCAATGRHDLPALGDPRRPVSRQRADARRRGHRADRLLLRLHRHHRLRPRGDPCRLVLRQGRRAVRPGSRRGAARRLRGGPPARAGGAGGAAAARARRGAALPRHAAPTTGCNTPAGALVTRKDPMAFARRLAVLRAAGRGVPGAPFDDEHEARGDLHRRRLQGQSRPGRLGRAAAHGRATRRSCRGGEPRHHQQPHGDDRRDPRRSRR